VCASIRCPATSSRAEFNIGRLDGGRPSAAVEGRGSNDGNDPHPRTAAQAGTLADAITRLDGEYPGIKDRICDEAGQIRRFVNVYVNGEDVRFLDNVDTKLGPNDEVSIVPAVAGGL
jgi:molybdopterin synthase sulfur carrier subunit